jgi:hypothetical protein
MSSSSSADFQTIANYTVIGLASIFVLWSTNHILKEVYGNSSNNNRNSTSMNMRPKKKLLAHTVEIMVCDIESVFQAIRGGANSLELCTNKAEGGTTPSIGLIEEVVNVCRTISVEVNVLIRPRGGDFVYSDAEFELIQRDILAAKRAGVDGKIGFRLLFRSLLYFLLYFLI